MSKNLPDKKAVIFGGHDTWIKSVKPMLPSSTKFCPRGRVPDSNLIRNSEVWVQPNAIAHQNYYKILNETRTNNKQIHYFSYASAKKCADQFYADTSTQI